MKNRIKKAMPFVFVGLGVFLILLSFGLKWIRNLGYEEDLDSYVVANASGVSGNDECENDLTKTKALEAQYSKSLLLTDYNELPSILGYIRIDTLDLIYPIYRYVTDENLEKGICHTEGTALPGYGASLLAGHTGVYGQQFFSNIGKLSEGDEIDIYMNDECLTYTVTGSVTVLPENVSDEWAKADEDTLVLITCTPAGSNTHRLLVTAFKKEDLKQ